MADRYRLYKYHFYFVILTLSLLNISVKGQGPVDASSITDKVVCGYQGWFSCAGDGSPINLWFHWSGTTQPEPGHLSFEVYPDVSLYDSPDLYLTGFTAHGDGQPSRLFSSYKADVIAAHFALMQTHGIDGIALQRFASELVNNPSFKENRDSIAVRVKRSAENYERLFYLMYDISGLAASNFDSMQTDWQNNITGTLEITSSPLYARQNGEPVVCIWGFGFTDRSGSASECLAVINWFKNHGCYVIGGVPTNWRTSNGDSKPGFENVYLAFDMISPWTVGRFSNITGANNYKTDYLIPDLAYCNTHGIAYQPVTFPGFAWSNWNGGTKNQIPRNKGEFLWQQVENIQSLGIPSVYMAMFDEYDEGTALLNMADGYSMIPTNQYFLTSSADGTYISPDFYLRLTGKATRVIKGIDEVTTTVTIPYSAGPVYFRTSSEADIDPQPTWNSTSENKVNVTAYGSNLGNPACAAVTANPHKGSKALRIQGRDRSESTSYVYFKVFDVDIPVDTNTLMHFWTYPTNEISRFVSVDLIMTDGTSLRDSGALDINGGSMHPAAGRGIVNTWTKTTSVIGTWLAGKTVDRILIAYDHGPETGDFRTYADDISIDEGDEVPVITWMGSQGSDWFDPANWSAGEIPSATTDIFITAGATELPVINAFGAECRDMTINTPFTINSGYSLSVYGDWRANDNLNMPDDATVIFKGSSGTIIDGYTYFYNLEIDKSGPSITLTDEDEFYPKTSFEVTNNLTVTSGHLVLNGSDWDYFIGNDLAIGSSGILTSNHWFPLHVKGNWTNNGGWYNPGTCNIIFDGATQTIYGSTTTQIFHNLLIRSTISTTLNANVTQADYLEVDSGTTFHISTGKTLTVGAQ
jgi:hypothetical protein